MAIKSKRNYWKLWALALGEKASKCSHDSDFVAIVRSVIFFTYLITNLFICAGVLRHWNDNVPVHKVAQGLGRSLENVVY